MTLARLLLPLVLGLAAAPALAQSGPPPGGGAPKGPTKVGVMVLEQAEVPRRSVLPGRAIASQEARIRPRVTGMVTEILYTPGQRLEAGTPMFRLDDSTLQAEVESARATVARAQAALTLAEAAATRARALEGSGSTRVTVETAEAEAAQARAELSGAEAALHLAEQDLNWAEIRSPITGIAGFASVSVGDLVTAGQSEALATVTTLDPIWVDLYEPAARLLSIREQIKAGALTPEERLEVTLTLENGQTHQGEGNLVAPSVAVSTTTGTQDFRFSFANPDGLIRPGMFLRGAVVVGRMEAIRVPQRAATIGRGGVLSVFLAEAGKAVKATVTPAGSDGNDWLVTEGLQPGAALIVDGLTNLRDGAEVEPVPVTIDAQGVVRDAAPAQSAPAAAGN
ncbi:MAG: efflux RND transporter periplasmic adaptor subunit [Gemmobacter sp.]|uniref:efflux RND transporter periplasmic adaptor subunit n=1 Tax=Gemmobacter sp. TaxID=1898957 RepID=UPI001A3CE1B2|nr:efflux RND transporter periplasmic adaptor subunit [Gemmobacter sp.]MBL8563533.1 efflux RND transporter periplasmic adaptor subunit [Gemmobacter sp.]